METQNRPSPQELCESRGIPESTPGYERLLRYAAVGEWLTRQAESKTGLLVPTVNYQFMADANLMMALFDDTTDTGEEPEWEQTYQPALVPEDDPLYTELLRSIEGVPSILVDSWEANSALLGQDKVQRIAVDWNGLVTSMYEHKLAAVSGSSIEQFVATRLGEASALASLYAEIMLGGEDIYLSCVLQRWLRVEMSAGNIMDSILDYKEDVGNGHKEWSPEQWARICAKGLGLSYRFFTDPMTSNQDRQFMIRKFLRNLTQKVKHDTKASSSSELAQLI